MSRRTLSVAAITVGAVVAALVPGAATGEDARPLLTAASPLASAGDAEDAVLTRASRALDERPVSSGSPAERIDATLALRDLFLARPGLDGDADLAAGRLLARPTDGAQDPYGDGYSVPSTKRCSKRFCLHHVTRTADAPPSQAWVGTTLSTLERVWSLEVGRLGYRAPASDGGRGGNAKFDVYLKDLGDQGLYGYCAPERRVAGRPKAASGFCVLDDDFSRAQYGRAPIDSLRVTAAHEFFHAVQFAYDFGEDPWLLESTATWMEERFADAVNDNRSYLRYGQVAQPAQALDTFDPSGFNQYGNWTFWEYLSQRKGNKIVRQVWQRAGTGGGLPDDYSTQAVRKVLASRGGLTPTFAAYAGGNTVPGPTYPEGGSWPSAAITTTKTVGASSRRASWTTRIDHLSSKNLKVRPGSGLSGSGWRLKVKIDGPARATMPAAYVIVRRADGSLLRRAVPLNATGFGSTTFSFGARNAKSATVTVANVSTRYDCGRGTTFSCQGVPRDQDTRFAVKTVLSRR